MARKPTVTFVQLRLMPEMAEELRRVGDGQGRKLPAEIVYRLSRTLRGADPEIERALFGATGRNVARNRALGQAVGYLAARVQRVVGASGDEARDSATTFAMLKVALPVLLDALGADDKLLTADHRALAQAFAKAVANELATAEDPERAIVAHASEEGQALARIAKDIGLPASRRAAQGRSKKSGK